MRLFIKKLQEGTLNIDNEKLFPSDFILRANSAKTLLDSLMLKYSTPRQKTLVECAKKAFSFSHIYDTQVFNIELSKLIAGAPAIVVSHQPTLFPYSGIYVQFCLADYLVKRLRLEHGIEAVIVYLCLDTDDAKDRRITTAHFPFPSAIGGSIPISYRVEEFYKNTPQFSVPFSPLCLGKEWKQSIMSRFSLLTSISPEYKDELLVAKNNIGSYYDHLFNIATENSPSTFSDFSMSILMRFIKDIVDIPVIPIRFSDLISTGRDTIVSILSQWGDIAKTGIELLNKFGIDRKNMFDKGPAWIICRKCYFRNHSSHHNIFEALYNRRINQECDRCGANLDVIEKDFMVIPKVILEDLTSTLMLGSNLTLTYAGSAQHVLLSNMINHIVFGQTPSIYTWHPRHFLGSVLEKASIDLITRSNRIDSASQALRLASGGRDTLLFLSQMKSLKELSANWERHMSNLKLNDIMIFDKNYDLYEKSIFALSHNAIRSQ